MVSHFTNILFIMAGVENLTLSNACFVIIICIAIVKRLFVSRTFVFILSLRGVHSYAISLMTVFIR